MSKTKIIDKKSEKSINGEREFLSYLHHSFIVNMHYAFQDSDNLYLVMDLLTGGDLRYHCSRYRSFSEEQTRFFLACIIHSLSYIHKNNVIHRDIKPENLVLDENGYVHITDFGVAKKNMPDNSSETSGTPGYMSPEVMFGKNHSFPVDFFSIGVIGYEFLMGHRPYRGRERKEIKDQMVSYQAKIKENEIKKGWSLDAIDFINLLLMRKEKKRLGYKNGVKELKEHPWIKYYPWKDLAKKKLPTPFIPDKKDNFDKKYCESMDEISEETQLRYEEIAFSKHFKTAFNNFYFNKSETKWDENNLQDESLTESESEKNDKIDVTKSLSVMKLFPDYGNKNIFEKKITNLKPKVIENKRKIKKDINFQKSKIMGKTQNISKDIFSNIDLKNMSNRTQNRYTLHKNKSMINILKRKINPNARIINYSNSRRKNDTTFINIKKISINCKDSNSKMLKNDSMNKSIMKSNKSYNDINKYFRNNSLNRSRLNFINNNKNNINIYLNINMFNKMINNHFNQKKKNINHRNPFQELLFDKKKLIKIEKSKKSLESFYNNHNNNINKYFNNLKNEDKSMRAKSVISDMNKNYQIVKNIIKNNSGKNSISTNLIKYKNNINNNSISKNSMINK